jgi:hypothetical protein
MHALNLDQPKHCCDSCDEKFWEKRKLTMHRRMVHTGEQVFKCQLCEFCCLHVKSLRAHMRTKHADCVEEQVEQLEVVEEEVSTSNEYSF